MKEGTIFTLQGKVWGYDISIFNYLNKNEIILEPETLFLVEEIIVMNDIIHLRCSIEESPLILTDNFIKIKYLIDKNNNRIKLFGGYFIQHNIGKIPRIVCENEEFPFGNNLWIFDIIKYKNNQTLEILLYTYRIIDFSYMFYNCFQLLELPENWDVSGAHSMDKMFEDCMN